MHARFQRKLNFGFRLMDYPRAPVSRTQYRGIAGSGDEIEAAQAPTLYPGSYLRSPPHPHTRCKKTLAVAGHVAPRFWELTKKSIGGRVRRNSLSHEKLSSKEIFPSSTLQKSSTWNGNCPVINICIYRKYRITKWQVTNVNMCSGVLLFRLSDGDKRDTEEIF